MADSHRVVHYGAVCVGTGGCSGNTYVMDYANEPGSHDAQVSDKGKAVTQVEEDEEEEES